MTAQRKVLHTDAEIDAAGAALVEDWPPLTDEERTHLSAILAPIGEARRAKAAEHHPGAA